MSHDTKDEFEWIEKAKSEGPLPLLEPDNCSNGWASPLGDIFSVRGPNYLSSEDKIPGGEYLLKPLGFDWIKCTSKISEVMNNPNSRIRKALDEELAKGRKPFVWAFNLQIPSRDNYSIISYFTSVEPIQKGSLMDQFIKGDDAFRNSRLKMIANVVNGPWIVRKAVGEQAVCLIGKAVECNYSIGEHFIEVEVNIAASMVAKAVVHLAFGYTVKLTVDIAFLVEGQTESELPERILGAVRFSEMRPESAGVYENPLDNIETLQTTLSARLLKSIGDFARLLPGSPRSPAANTFSQNHFKEDNNNTN